MRKRSSKKEEKDFSQVALATVEHVIGGSLASRRVKPIIFPRPSATKNPAAVALGKLGGAKGGHARAAKLTPQAKKAIAQKAAKARWDKARLKAYLEK